MTPSNFGGISEPTSGCISSKPIVKEMEVKLDSDREDTDRTSEVTHTESRKSSSKEWSSVKKKKKKNFKL